MGGISVSLVTFLLALMLFLLLLAAMPLQFRITYRRVKQDDSLKVKLTGFFGLWHYQIVIPYADWRWALIPHLRFTANVSPSPGQAETVTEEVKPRVFGWGIFTALLNRFFYLLRSLRVIKRWFYKGIRCQELRWVMEVGFKDAAYTGLAVGGLWSIIGYYLGKLHTNITFQVAHPQVAVYPSFRQPVFKADFDCIFRLRLGHIIIAGFKVVKIVKSGLKGVKFDESPN